MNPGQLAHVVAAVEEGSFTQAALRCDVAQPSLSASIARLEQELGVPLFHRIGRTVTPTDACLALLPSARDALRALQSARSAVEGVRSGLTGRLEVAVQPTVIAPVVALVARYRRAHPGVVVRLRSPAEEGVAALVAAGGTELGIGDVLRGEDLVWEPLWTEEYVCIQRSRGRAATGDERCTAAELADVAVVAPPPGSPTRDVLDSWLADAGASPMLAVEVDHREALLPLVEAGCGAAVVPRSVVGAAGGSVRVRALDPPVERRIGIVRRPGPLTSAARLFIEVATEGRDR